MRNNTLLLLQILGSNPIYTTNINLIKNNSEKKVHELYLHAKINKIGYTFLKALENDGIINHYPELVEELIKQEEIFNKHRESLKIISDVLTDLNVDHVFIKTIYDFPVLPSDIDVLIRDKLSKELINALRRRGFTPFDKGPHFVSVYNTLVDPTIPRDKMNYDIDIYDEISLNYIIYLDKELCFKNYTKDSIHHVRVPRPEYELLIQLNHSVFEHLYTLLHFYTFIKLLSKIEAEEVKKLAKITRSENVLSLTSFITLAIINNVNLNVEKEQLLLLKNFISKDFAINIKSIPYRYTLTQILQVLLEKAKNPTYLYHMLNFMLHLLNPRQFTHVTSQILLRRRRESY